MVSPMCTIGQFVDDVKQFAAGESKASVINVLAPAATTFLKGVKEDNLLISKKSVVLASDGLVAEVLRGVAHSKGPS